MIIASYSPTIETDTPTMPLETDTPTMFLETESPTLSPSLSPSMAPTIRYVLWHYLSVFMLELDPHLQVSYHIIQSPTIQTDTPTLSLETVIPTLSLETDIPTTPLETDPPTPVPILIEGDVSTLQLYDSFLYLLFYNALSIDKCSQFYTSYQQCHHQLVC